MEKEAVYGFTVKDLFSIPHFKEAVLLGGRSGLEQTISRINVMEVPDVINWVKPGEFLMTTGYPLKHNPELFVTLIEQLVQKGVVALGIKTKRFIDTVPDSAVKAAEFHGLPLIELPPDTAFSDVVREVMERVLVTEVRQLTLLQSRVQRLSQVLLHGDGLHAFLHHLQLLIQNPVVLLDPGNRWMASPSAEHLCRQVDEAGWERLREDRTLETSFIQAGEQMIRVYITSVPDGQVQQPSLLLMLEQQSEYGIVDTLTMNWASELIGFEINNSQVRKKIEAKYIDQFLQDWIAGRIVSPADLRMRAEACGRPFIEGSSFWVGVVTFHERKPEVSDLQEIARRLNWDAAGKKDMIWTVLEESLVVLITLINSGEKDQKWRKDALGDVWSLLRPKLLEKRATLCLGREAQDQSGVPASFREAKRAAEVCRESHVNDAIVHYRDLGIYLLLYRLQGTEELEEYKRIFLQPLIEYDRKHQGSLLQTLRTYFLSNCNVKETAERLFIHYNTVNYRIERIRNELGFHLDDPETRLQLQIAVKLDGLNG